MYFLGIETATDACSVALYHNEQSIAVQYTDNPKTHSQYLSIFIQNVLEQANIVVTALSGIVVSQGPGSYTGLRIGMSVAKGLAYGLDIPLMLIPSTAVVAYSGLQYIQDKSAVIIGIIDAPNNEIYAQCFTICQNGILESVTAPEHYIVDEHILTTLGLDNAKTVYLAGKGALKIKHFYPNNTNIIVLEKVKQDLHNIGTWIIETYQQQIFVDTELCEPLYIKDFSPVLKSKKQKK